MNKDFKLYYQGELGAMKDAEEQCVNFNKDFKASLIGNDGEKYSFRYFTNESNTAVYSSINTNLTDEDTIREAILNPSGYEDITPEYIKEKLEIANDVMLFSQARQNAADDLYIQARNRNPMYDDDTLADTLVWCSEGQLLTHDDKYWFYHFDKMTRLLADEINNY